MNNARKSVLKTLLKGLGNAWSTHSPQEVASLLQQLQDLNSGSVKDFQWGGFSLPETGTEFQGQGSSPVDFHHFPLYSCVAPLNPA